LAKRNKFRQGDKRVLLLIEKSVTENLFCFQPVLLSVLSFCKKNPQSLCVRLFEARPDRERLLKSCDGLNPGLEPSLIRDMLPMMFGQGAVPAALAAPA
jgi:hypothetical protein